MSAKEEDATQHRATRLVGKDEADACVDSGYMKKRPARDRETPIRAGRLRGDAEGRSWALRCCRHLTVTRSSLVRLRLLTPLVLVIFAACWDTKHPQEMVGIWVRDSLYGGGIVRGTDTLRLRSDGLALRSGSIASTDAATNALNKPAVWAEGLKWAYRPRVEGPLLCLFVEEGQEDECHTVRLASATMIVVDGRSYQRLPGR